MDLIPILIGFPAVMAVILPFLKNERVRGIVVYIGAGCVIALALANLGMWLAGGGVTVNLYMDTELIFVCGSSVESPVIEAAELSDGKLIASETDKSGMSDTIIASAVKDIGRALKDALEGYADGEFSGGREISCSAEDGYISLAFDDKGMERFSKSDYKAVLKNLKQGNVKIKTADEFKLEDLRLSNVKIIEN